MTEAKEKNIQVRITRTLLEKLKDEQYSWRKSGKPEPSYAELLGAAWELYKRVNSEPGLSRAVAALPILSFDQDPSHAHDGNSIGARTQKALRAADSTLKEEEEAPGSPPASQPKPPRSGKKAG